MNNEILHGAHTLNAIRVYLELQLHWVSVFLVESGNPEPVSPFNHRSSDNGEKGHVLAGGPSGDKLSPFAVAGHPRRPERLRPLKL